MFDAFAFTGALFAGAAMIVFFGVGRSILRLAMMHLLVTSFLLSGCVTPGANAPHKNNVQQDLLGDWRVYYDVPDTMVFGLSLSVSIDETGLRDQSGNWSAREDPNSRISEGVVSSVNVTFRWIYQNVGANGETGPVLWDYRFEGHYELNEKGEDALRGSLSGTELNGLCEFPVSNAKPFVEKLSNGDCARHSVAGTWHAMRDELQ